MPASITLNHIKQAATALEKVILRTPTIMAPWLSDRINGQAFLKLESLQILGSFKARGAYIKLTELSQEQRCKGVIAMSAGNHAQGVAYHARKLGIPATIVMPKNTPFAKIEGTQKLGVILILEGQNLDEASAFATQHAQSEGLEMIHPYDDPAIIAGQGTVGLEMLADVPDLDTVIVPIGGGGLASGVAIAAKALNPNIHLIGVQAASYPAMAKALYPTRTFLTQQFSSSLAEGIAIKTPGLLTREILRKHLSDIVIVTEEQLEAALAHLLIDGKMIVEGAGAAGVAALMTCAEQFIGQKVGVIIGGGNIDARILSSLLLRGLAHQGKLVRLKIDLNDAPGVLGQISQLIGQVGGNIYEVSHQRLFNHITVKMAEIDAIVETHDHAHAEKIIATLQTSGFPTTLME